MGETGRALKERFREHRRNVINKVEDNEVANHYNSVGHHGCEDMMVYGLKRKTGTFHRRLEEQIIIARLGCVLGMDGLNIDFNFPQMLN